MRTIMLGAALVTGGAASAPASTPAAWAALKAKAEGACIEASRLGRPRLSNPVIFDDRTARIALLVHGSFRTARGRLLPVTNLCLYDRKTDRAVVEEAPGWAERRDDRTR